MFAPTADDNTPTLRQAITLTPGVTYNISYAYNFQQAIISQPAKAATLAYAATLSLAGVAVDVLPLAAAAVDQVWHMHSFVYTAPAHAGPLGVELTLGWSVTADPARISAGSQFAVDRVMATSVV